MTPLVYAGGCLWEFNGIEWDLIDDSPAPWEACYAVFVDRIHVRKL